MATLELLRDPAGAFPTIADPLSYERADILHCKYTTLNAISAFKNLKSLKVFSWPDRNLDALRSLTKLEQLQIVHLPQITSLEPLADLVHLRRLILATLPSWDSSGRVTEVESLAPLSRLHRLEEVNLFGVRPMSGSVDDLLAIPTLSKARISKYPTGEMTRLNVAVPNEWVTWH